MEYSQAYGCTVWGKSSGKNDKKWKTIDAQTESSTIYQNRSGIFIYRACWGEKPLTERAREVKDHPNLRHKFFDHYRAETPNATQAAFLRTTYMIYAPAPKFWVLTQNVGRSDSESGSQGRKRFARVPSALGGHEPFRTSRLVRNVKMATRHSIQNSQMDIITDNSYQHIAQLSEWTAQRS